jgi:Ca-activated chloride channel family protein
MRQSTRKTIRLTALALVFLLCAGLLCQFPVAAQEQDDNAIRVSVNLVLVDATVKTKTGQIMQELKKDDFELREDGRVQKLSFFGRDELPLNIAVVLDLSDSITPFFEPVRDATANTLATLKPEDRVALFTFATEAELRVPLTQDKDKLTEAFKQFRAGGLTNINDGIFVAAKYFLTTAPKGRRVIILISDDVATDAGGQSTSDIITEATAADASLYNLRIPGENSILARFAAGQIRGLVNLRRVADQTGGEIFDVPSADALEGALRALLTRIKTRYTLGYYTSANGAEGKPHKLEVRLTPVFGRKDRDYAILAKSGFYFVP